MPDFSETGAVLSDANEPIEDVKPLDPETLAKLRAKMKKMQFNKDVEHIKVLVRIISSNDKNVEIKFYKLLITLASGIRFDLGDIS